MSMAPATPRDLIVAGLVSVVGQGVAVMAPHVGPALESAKAAIARSVAESPSGTTVSAADPALAWAENCVAAWRKSVEAAPELLALADSPLDDKLPSECNAPVEENNELAEVQERSFASTGEAAVATEPPHHQTSLWDGQLDRASGVTSVAEGVPDKTRNDTFTRRELPLALAELDSMRGGFETDSGLRFSFGIEQAVYINGQLITTQTLNSLDLRGGGVQQIAMGADPGQVVTLIQNGSGNSIDPSSLPGRGVVIQNTLNNQAITTQTKINASVNSLQALRSINLGDQIQQAIVGSTRK